MNLEKLFKNYNGRSKRLIYQQVIPPEYESEYRDIFGENGLTLNLRDNFQKRLYKKLLNIGLNPTRSYILGYLKNSDNISTFNIMDYFNISRQNVYYHTKVLRFYRILEVTGQIDKEIELDDGRVVIQKVNLFSLTKEFKMFFFESNLYSYFDDSHRIANLIYSFYIHYFEEVPDKKSSSINYSEIIREKNKEILELKMRLRRCYSLLSEIGFMEFLEKEVEIDE